MTSADGTSSSSKALVLLLIEDNAGDADFVRDVLTEDGSDDYEIVHVPRLVDAVEKLRSLQVDVVLLDLRLPDSVGAESVRTVRERAGGAPIVVLTGSDDEQVARACLDAGAEDFLTKADARARNIRRSIGYATARRRESQLRELEESLERYRLMSSESSGTSVTASLAGAGPLSGRAPETFAHLVRDYVAVLEPCLGRSADPVEPTRAQMELIATRLGDANGGPRDLIDIHVAAMDSAIGRGADPYPRSLVVEARLFALQMMGLLVDHYRVGHRRFTQRASLT